MRETPIERPGVSRRWFSLAQASEYVSLSGKTLMKYIREGMIYGTCKGGKWLIDRESIDRWLEEDKIRILSKAYKRAMN